MSKIEWEEIKRGKEKIWILLVNLYCYNNNFSFFFIAWKRDFWILTIVNNILLFYFFFTVFFSNIETSYVNIFLV